MGYVLYIKKILCFQIVSKQIRKCLFRKQKPRYLSFMYLHIFLDRYIQNQGNK